VKRLLPLLFLAWFLTPFPAAARAAERFELVDGDRVALLGSTVIEREQRWGYWETMLTTRYPGCNLVFRNLGWSGDTVWGEARAAFDTPKEGYKRLLDATFAVKPTVIVLGYGTNESFAGEAGLPRFVEQLNKLLDDLAPTRARFVLLAPPLFEEVSWRANNFDQRVRDLALYSRTLREIADKRHLFFVREFCQRYRPGSPLTDDGMHLTDYGYSATAGNLVQEMGIAGKELKRVELDGLKPCEVLQEVLTNPPVPPEAPKGVLQADTLLTVHRLKPGKYTLQIDGRPIHIADADAWMKPARFGQVLLPRGPSLDQAEKLRRTIVEKNRLYFHLWRPENETYLFGFRKHEQGQNAREVPQFEPLVEELEKDIARLRKPVSHTYQLVPAGEENK
jgi:lysophospholipase L1-like esterase